MWKLLLLVINCDSLWNYYIWKLYLLIEEMCFFIKHHFISIEKHSLLYSSNIRKTSTLQTHLLCFLSAQKIEANYHFVKAIVDFTWVLRVQTLVKGLHYILRELAIHFNLHPRLKIDGGELSLVKGKCCLRFGTLCTIFHFYLFLLYTSKNHSH